MGEGRAGREPDRRRLPRPCGREHRRRGGEGGDCSTYTANGHEYSKVKAFDLPKVAPADAKHAWCMVEAKEDVTICHSVIAAQDLISSLWVRSGDADEAEPGWRR